MAGTSSRERPFRVTRRLAVELSADRLLLAIEAQAFESAFGLNNPAPAEFTLVSRPENGQEAPKAAVLLTATNRPGALMPDPVAGSRMPGSLL
jgi:hypothetical protein